MKVKCIPWICSLRYYFVPEVSARIQEVSGRILHSTQLIQQAELTGSYQSSSLVFCKKQLDEETCILCSHTGN